MVRPLALALLASATLLPGTPANADGGDLLWQDQLDRAGGEDVARAVAAGNGRVFAVGSAQNAAGNSDLLVRAYDARTGALVWTDLVDAAGGNDAATTVVLEDDRVFVGGTSVDAAGARRLILRVYTAKRGKLVWEARPALASFSGLAVAGSHVVVAGTTTDLIGNPRLVVQAYVAKDGVLDWEDQPAPPTGYERFDGATRGVTIQGRQVFVAGTVRKPGPDFSPSCLIRAYAARNGRLEWQALHLSPNLCNATAIATDGKRVIVAALSGSALDDFMAQSYDAETGQFLWEDRTLVGTALNNEAVAVDIERRQAFVVGWVRWVPGQFNQEAFLVRAYDTGTGFLNWEDQFPSAVTCFCHARDVTVGNGRVFAVGVGPGTWLVRVYNAKSGDLRWTDEFAPVGGVGDPFGATGALGVAVDRGKVFVAGSGINASGNADFIIRAYDAK